MPTTIEQREKNETRARILRAFVKEVSIVDRAANEEELLAVKNAAGGAMNPEATTTPATDVEVEKAMDLHKKLLQEEGALARILLERVIGGEAEERDRDALYDVIFKLNRNGWIVSTAMAGEVAKAEDYPVAAILTENATKAGSPIVERLKKASELAGDNEELKGVLFELETLFAKEADTEKAAELNTPGNSHARSLVEGGKVDRESSWAFSGDDGNKILGDPPDWSNYAKWFLGVNRQENEETKARFRYPFGKDGKVFRSAVIAIKQRAAAEGDVAVAEAAGRLLEMIDKDKEKDEGAKKGDEEGKDKDAEKKSDDAKKDDEKDKDAEKKSDDDAEDKDAEKKSDEGDDKDTEKARKSKVDAMIEKLEGQRSTINDAIKLLKGEDEGDGGTETDAMKQMNEKIAAQGKTISEMQKTIEGISKVRGASKGADEPDVKEEERSKEADGLWKGVL